jgi:hypothetical protein
VSDDNDLLKLHMEQDQQRFESIETRFTGIDTKLDVLIANQNKQKGFIAGVSMAFSLLASAVIGLGLYIWRQATGHQ